MNSAISIVCLVAVTAFAPVRPAHSQSTVAQDEVLTNSSVIHLVQSKLARKLIIAKIRDSRNAFDVSAAGLVSLKAREVPEEVLEVMLESAAETAAQDALSNQGVVQMLDAKLSRNLVIAKIRSATPAFDMTTKGLVDLQQRKVPRQVIEVMMTAGNSSSSLVSAPQTAGPPPPAAGRAAAEGTAQTPPPAPKLPPLAAGSLPWEAGI